MAARGAWNYQSARQTTITTTGSIDNLDFEKTGMLIFNNASLSTVRGLKAGYDGQLIGITSIGAGQVDFAHQNANSLAANRLINAATSANTSLAAGKGSCVYQYDGETARWRLVSHIQGSFITPAFSAGDFTGNASMTWTVAAGDRATMQYYLDGALLTIVWTIVTTTIGGTPSSGLQIANGQFGGFSISGGAGQHAWIDNGVTAGVGIVGTAATSLTCYQSFLTPVWTACADLAYTSGQVITVAT